MRPTILRVPVIAITSLVLISSASAQFDPPDAIDINPDPDIVEIELEAAETTWEFIPGIPTTVWAFNGQVPGPTIRAKAGDQLIVHFTNNLEEASTIHWHGLETPAGVDGSHISQLLVQPGETFDYEFTLNQYGLYWYHPHVRTFDQVERGLYGVMLVRDASIEGPLGLLPIEEHIIVFDDVLLDDNNEIVDAFSHTDPLENVLYHLDGRVGNVLLVNGKEASSVNLDMENGEPQRWRVVNVSNTEFARLDVADSVLGNDGELFQIGSDGGLNDRSELRLPVTDIVPPHPITTGPQSREGIFLTPGERGDYIYVPVGTEDAVHTVVQKDWIRGRHLASYDGEGNIVLTDDLSDGTQPDEDYFTFTLIGPDPGQPYYRPPFLLDTSLTIPDPSTATQTFQAAFGHGDPTPEGDVTFFSQVEFLMDSAGNTVMNPLPTAKITSEKAFDAQVGDTVLWELTNLSHGDHPFHAHGFFFTPYEVEYTDLDTPGNNVVVPVVIAERKDTVRMPARTGLKGRSTSITRAIMEIDDTGREGLATAQGELPTRYPDGSLTSGGWLFHCHVLEHSGKGMLSFFEVHDPADPFWLYGRHLDGTYGKPSLTASGPLTSGSTVDVELVDALENSPAVLVAGTRNDNLSLLGGTLVPNLEALFFTSTDASGNATWNPAWVDSLPSGSHVYLQAVIVDPLAVNGFAFSNAIDIQVP